MNNEKKSRHGLIVLIILLIAVIAGFIVYFKGNISFKFSSPEPKTDLRAALPFKFYNSTDTFSSSVSKSFTDYCAVLKVEGVIQEKNKTYNHEWFIKTVKDLKNDAKNQGILLEINSPGGTVYQSDEIYLALLDYRKSGKPVYAYLESIAASGGYYIACGADRIYANRNTLTGSIGVIAGQSVDLTELMQKHGIKVTTFTAGKNKNMLNYNSPLTKEQKDIMQYLADEAYSQFTGIVAQGRNLDINKVKVIADGRIYSARQALELSLIDGINSIADTQALIQLDIQNKNGKTVQFKKFQQKNDMTFSELFTSFYKAALNIKSDSESIDIKNLLSKTALPEDLKYPAYYYQK
jgi:protease-4